MIIARVVLFLSSTATIIVPTLDGVNYFQAVNVKKRPVVTVQHDGCDDHNTWTGKFNEDNLGEILKKQTGITVIINCQLGCIADLNVSEQSGIAGLIRKI